jgi:ParB family chromosome partitioning protein
MEIDINQIKPSPYQPRTVFDVEELKENIKHDGLLMALTVRKVNDYYELIDGDRRLHALKELGIKTAECSVIIADDALARKMVWKINIERADYSVEEKARYLKKLSDTGMTFYAIGKELNEYDQWVLANINVFKFALDIQQAVWCGKLTISYIKELESIIGAGRIDDAEKDLHEAINRKLTRDELRKIAKPQIDEIENQRLEAAKTAIGTLTDIGPRGPTRFSVPEDYENAAKLLKNKAKEERLSKLSEEDKIKIEEEKTLKQKDKNQKHKEVIEKIKAEAEEKGRIKGLAQKASKDPTEIQAVIQQVIEDSKNAPVLSPVKLTPEQEADIKKAEDELAKIQNSSSAQNNLAVNKNWLAHGQILGMAGSLRCPCCGKTIEELVWKCCGISIQDAYKQLEEK